MLFRRCTNRAYQILGDNQVVVVAIIHTRRKPGYWKNRMFDVLPYRKYGKVSPNLVTKYPPVKVKFADFIRNFFF